MTPEPNSAPDSLTPKKSNLVKFPLHVPAEEVTVTSEDAREDRVAALTEEKRTARETKADKHFMVRSGLG